MHAKVHGLSMVEVDNDIFVIGGKDPDWTYHKSIHKLYCNAENACEWIKQKGELSHGRAYFSVMPYVEGTKSWPPPPPATLPPTSSASSITITTIGKVFLFFKLHYIQFY